MTDSDRVSGLGLVSLTGMMLHADDGLCAFLNIAHDRFVDVGTAVWESVGGADALAAVLESARSGHTGGHTEVPSRTNDGRIVHVRWRLVRRGGVRTAVAVAVDDHDDEAVGRLSEMAGRLDDPFVSGMLDTLVTAASHDEGDTQRLEAQFRARYVQSALPQAMTDLTGALTSVNDAFCKLVGRSRADLLGSLVSDLAHSEDGGPATALLEMLAGVREAAQLERLITGPDGQAVPVCIDITVLRDDEGDAYGAAAFVHDLTVLRESEAERRHQDAFFFSLSVLAGDLAVVTDANGRLVYISPAVVRVLGYAIDELIGREPWHLVHPDDLQAVREAHAAVAATDGASRQCTYRLAAADGTWLWMSQTATNLLAEAIGGIVINLRDVTDQVEDHRALRESEARFRAVADTAEEGIWAVDWNGLTLYANARMGAILGLPLTRLYEVPVVMLLDRDGAADMVQRLDARGTRGVERYEMSYTHPDGRVRQLGVAASPLPGSDGAVGSLAVVTDVTDTRRIEDELRHASLHDRLTGLPNRALLVDRIEHALKRAFGTTAVLFVGLDHFQLLNASHGHAVGDGALVAVAQRLRAAVREHDTVARFGTDEFVILAEDTDERRARSLGADVLEAIGAAPGAGTLDPHLSASLGIGMSPGSAHELLRYAHSAMHAAKASGRGRVRMFDRAMTDDAEDRYALGSDLRAALREEELDMHFQPILDLQTGAVVGTEALARWQHPVHGQVPPTRFVAVAEATGLTPELDRWAVRAALHGARTLRACGAVPAAAYVSINLSPHNLGVRAMEDFIVDETADAGFAPADVVLEITERAVMTDPVATVALLKRLRRRGYGVAIDDFGTGQSSLTYLRDLPVTSLKIDVAFVAEMHVSSDASAIVASIVDLARAVGISATAEGVELAEQSSLLRGMGCDYGQGWLWSPAKSVEDAQQDGGWSSGFNTGPAQALALPGGRDRLKVERKHGLDRMVMLHHSGASLSTIAAALNVDGYVTPKGLRWHSTSVARAIADFAYPLVGAHASRSPKGPES